MPEKTTAIQIELPKGLLDAVDRFVDAGQFTTRTEVIRAAVREFMNTRSIPPRQGE